jgi:hypothetical protein
MSKFRYSAILSFSASESPATYSFDPMRPDSSAPHHAKRTALVGLTLAICSATSRMAADPEPLSLMPGPAWTESRCAPAMTTLLGLPHLLWAMTLVWVISSWLRER